MFFISDREGYCTLQGVANHGWCKNSRSRISSNACKPTWGRQWPKQVHHSRFRIRRFNLYLGWTSIHYNQGNNENHGREFMLTNILDITHTRYMSIVRSWYMIRLILHFLAIPAESWIYWWWFSSSFRIQKGRFFCDQAYSIFDKPIIFFQNWSIPAEWLWCKFFEGFRIVIWLVHWVNI